MSSIAAAMWCIWTALLLAFEFQHVSSLPPVAVAGLKCPGASGAACGRQCQTHICEVLTQFYRVSNNASDPWDNEDGWQRTISKSCAVLVAEAGRPQQIAAYCSWFGVMCCTPAAVAAGNCTVLNTVAGLNMPMNNMNVSLGNPQFVAAIQQLHDCGMTVLNLEANNLSGKMNDKAWSNLVNLQVINFANSWIEGSIPQALRVMRNLTRINLSNSYMYGSLPEWIGELQQLELLNLGTMAGVNYETGLGGTIPGQIGNLRKLKELILESNYLSGTLPPQLCKGGDDNPLLLVNLRANSFEGSTEVLEGCGNLVQLDISQNNFTGQLPSSKLWVTLTTYQASNNNFSGSFPFTLCINSQILETLDISHNHVTGQIPNQITLLSGLKTLNLGNNRFTGTLTENVYYLPGLKVLDISNNGFVGTIPTAIEYPYGLTSVDYSNNTGFTGILPPQMGFLLNLQKARTTGTSMSCSGVTKPYIVTTNASCNDPSRCTTPRMISGDASAGQPCSDSELLPCFLRFSDESLPREDSSNMRCKFITRKPPAQAKADCAGGSDPYTLSDNAEYLPDIVKDSTEQSWLIDPSYYQYRECTCLQGYSPIWTANGTILQCVESPASDHRTAIVVAAISAVAGLALLAVLVLLAQLYLRTRPKWLRERIMQAKRMQGAPKCAKPGDKAPVSIVVTDVKDFSALTGQYHELMMKAMGAHNNILRKACHTHAGYVMDQEGDSWTIAFHDPLDAVAFSLQVQQALSQKVWGVRLPTETPLGDHVEGLRYSELSGFSSFSRSKSMTQGTGLGTAGGYSGSGAGPQQPSVSQSVVPGCSSTGTATAGGGLGPGYRYSQDSICGPYTGAPLDPLGENAAVTSTNLAAPGAAALQGSGNHYHQSVQQQVQQECQVAPRSRSFLNPLTASFTSSIARSSVGRSSVGGLELIQQSFTEFTAGSANALARLFDRKTSIKPGHSQQRPQPQYSDPLPQLYHNSNGQGSLQHAGKETLSDPLPQVPATASEEARIVTARTSSNNSLKQQHDVEYGSATGGWGVNRSSSSFNSSISVFDRVFGGSSKVDRSMVNSFTSSGRRRGAASSLMHRFSQFANKDKLGGDQQPLKLLRLAVRIGVASGPLPYEVSLGNCAVKHRAKRIISEAAAGGQVLCDEPTFLCIKDSLSVLGTVNEGGYDNDLLQSLMHAQVVGKLQRQMACVESPCLRACDKQHQLSFTGGLWGREPQDYDNDAIAVHMGCFDVPNAPVDEVSASNASSESSSPTSQSGDLELVDMRAASTTAATVSSAGAYRCCRQKMHFYSIASPGMRKHPEEREGLGFEEPQLGWAERVTLKGGWIQSQKGYFEAPSAGQMDLTPGSHLLDSPPCILSDVTVVFVSVAGAATFTAKHPQKEIYAVHKTIIKCMLQQMNSLPGRDGYLCRCQESDLRYMIAFEHPHKAVQWCLLVQEALMYASWSEHVLSHPGFEEQLCPVTGLPLFRGPKLRMGLAEGQPNSVLPDHNGRANYYGGSVNRAARYMDAAAHGGQVVTDLALARKVLWEWDREHARVDKTVLGFMDRGSINRLASENRMAMTESVRERADVKVAAGDGVAHSTIAASEADSVGGSTYDTGVDDDQHMQHSTSKQPPQQQDPLLQLVKRSASETAAARSQAFSGKRNLPPLPRSTEARDPSSMGLTVRCKSFTDDLPCPTTLIGPQAGQYEGLFTAATAPAGAKPPGDEVVVQHLGRFSFKGSGEYDMVQLLHTATADRTFPAEPPRGKGQRVTAVDAAMVAGMGGVRLRIPAAVTAARQAYRVMHY